MSKVKYTKPYVTTAEAALITGFNQRFLQRQCQEGAIEGAQKMGNTWVIPTGWACERMESYAPHDGVVSLLDAACTAGVSRQTIVNWVKDGKLKGYCQKIGERHRWEVDEADLKRLVKPTPQREERDDYSFSEYLADVVKVGKTANEMDCHFLKIMAAEYKKRYKKYCRDNGYSSEEF